VTCETFKLAEKLGLDLQTFFDISSKASGQNWSMTSYCPVPGVGPTTPADNGYQGGFASALMLKDLRLAMEAAHSVGARRGGLLGDHQDPLTVVLRTMLKPPPGIAGAAVFRWGVHALTC